MTVTLKKTRFDYFLIWGHGLAHQREILAVIRSEPAFRIVRIQRHRPRDLAGFVREVYAFDYAPFEHLESKTHYLLSTPLEVMFVFLENRDVHEVVEGEGAFRHVECMRIKAVKQSIRDAFNPRFRGVRSEDHVVHATDNQQQTDKILRYLGFPDGVGFLRSGGHKFLNHTPYHISRAAGFSVRQVPLSKLECRLHRMGGGSGSSPGLEAASAEETPHFQCLQGDSQAYDDYYAQSQGEHLTDDHSPESLRRLANRFEYLKAPHDTCYILTRYAPERDRFVVMDGVHRVAILASQEETEVIVAVLEP